MRRATDGVDYWAKLRLYYVGAEIAHIEQLLYDITATQNEDRLA